MSKDEKIKEFRKIMSLDQHANQVGRILAKQVTEFERLDTPPDSITTALLAMAIGRMESTNRKHAAEWMYSIADYLAISNETTTH